MQSLLTCYTETQSGRTAKAVLKTTSLGTIWVSLGNLTLMQAL